uniref:Uncharacterized protein n=1 Tax=Cacopsylla melanoneura TaxID=428564 RepID=A0A8D9FKI4_9HEMI
MASSIASSSSMSLNSLNLNMDALVFDALKFLSAAGTPVDEQTILNTVNFKANATLSHGQIRNSLSALYNLHMIDVFVPLPMVSMMAFTGCCGDAGGCCGGGCCKSSCCGGCGCGRYYRVKIGSLV